nr:MAG TPA: hypothetical protein [Bacteriophage sp.]
MEYRIFLTEVVSFGVVIVRLLVDFSSDKIYPFFLN